VSRSLPDDRLADLFTRVEEAPGQAPVAEGWQPVHTVYVPADRFRVGTIPWFGREAVALLDRHTPDPATFAAAIEADAEVAGAVHERVRSKLEREPVEDVRIDFEDGYGVRDDVEEDGHAQGAAEAVAEAVGRGLLSRRWGVRVKSFADGLHGRSVRTLDVFLTAALERAGGALPDGFVLTFPKVVDARHVAAFSETVGRLEEALGLTAGSLRFEVQIETPQSVLDPEGRAAIPAILHAADGRLSAAHFGVFDYTSSLGLMPWEQRLDHPANDFARLLTQVALGGTGVEVSDGSTNVIPAGDTAEDVHAAWRVHAAHVRHSLRHGFFQGWDLHPSHLPSRFGAVYGWLLPHLDDAVRRVRAWREQAMAGGVLDEPATVRSLLRYLRRVVRCGAADEPGVLAATGLSRDELFGTSG
jgi:citrate lyase beta subunit